MNFYCLKGELDTSKMGLYNNESSLPNYIIYLLFISLMCTIVLNLFVGIAVNSSLGLSCYNNHRFKHLLVIII